MSTALREYDNRNLADVVEFQEQRIEVLQAEIRRLHAELEVANRIGMRYRDEAQEER